MPAGPTVRSVGPVRSLRANGRLATGGPLAYAMTGAVSRAIATAPPDANITRVAEDLLRPKDCTYPARQHIGVLILVVMPMHGRDKRLWLEDVLQ